MKNDDSSLTVVISIVFILGFIIFAALQPYFEAKAFNDCTGGNASYFTAVFTELRVQDCEKK